MIHRPARAAFRPRDGQPEPSSSSGHDRRSYTTARDAITGRRRPECFSAAEAGTNVSEGPFAQTVCATSEVLMGSFPFPGGDRMSFRDRVFAPVQCRGRAPITPVRVFGPALPERQQPGSMRRRLRGQHHRRQFESELPIRSSADRASYFFSSRIRPRPLMIVPQAVV